MAAHYHRKNIGGAEVQMFLLASQLVSSGWNVVYLSPDIDKIQIDEGVHLRPLTSVSTCSDLEREVRNALNDINPQIVYQRGRSVFTSACWNYCKESGVPLVFALSMDIDCRLFRNALRTKEYSSRNPVRWLWSMVRMGGEDIRSFNAMKKAEMVFCQTELQERRLRQIRKKELMVVRNMHPKPAALIKKKRLPVVLWLASIKAWKQPELFLELAKKMEGSRCRFILAGRMADERYRQLVTEMKKHQYFSYVENIDLDLSNDLIASSSVFVNTSLSNEGFPNTFIQSWLREVPTVSLQFDPDNLIQNKKLGFVSQTKEQMCRDVQSLISDEKSRQEIGIHARLFAEETFSNDIIYPKIEAIFKKMIL